MKIVFNINILCSKAVFSSDEKTSSWIEEGKNFLNILKILTQTKNLISKLNIKGAVTEDLHLINKAVRDFYNNLYCSKYSKAICKSFLQSI